MGMMKKKDRVLYRTTLYIDYEVFKVLKKVALKQERTITELVNEAIKEYLKAQGDEVKDDESKG